MGFKAGDTEASIPKTNQSTGRHMNDQKEDM